MEEWSLTFEPLYEASEDAGIIDPKIESEVYSYSEQRRLRLEKVNVPGYAVCKPATLKHNARVILILPGGGYSRLAIDHEGWAVAEWLAAAGHVGIVLKYRLPDAALMKAPQMQPLRDALKGISVLKKVCASLELPLSHAGVLGFSAGGHLAAWAVQEYLALSPKPENIPFPGFQILAYPVIDLSGVFTHLGSRNQLTQSEDDKALHEALSIHLMVHSQSRPTYLLHAMDDFTVPPQNSQLMETACINNGVPVTCEWLPEGGHGFGLYASRGKDSWLKNALLWAEGLYSGD